MSNKGLRKIDNTFLREASYGHPVLVKQALNEGANVNVQQAKTKKTALILATEKGERVVIETLIEMRKGELQLETGDQYGMTALHYAASRNHLDIIKILVDSGADVDCSNSVGCTPLHEAAAAGRASAIKMLCKAGANAHMPDKTGKTPHDVATQFKKQSSAKVLKKAMDGYYASKGKSKSVEPKRKSIEPKRKSDASAVSDGKKSKKKTHPKNNTMIRKDSAGVELNEIVDEMDHEAEISSQMDQLTLQVGSLQQRITQLQHDKIELQSQLTDNTPQETKNVRTKLKLLKEEMTTQSKLMLDKDHELALKEREVSKWRQDNLKLKHQIEKSEEKNTEIVAHYEARLHDTTKSYSAVRNEIKKRQDSMSPIAPGLERTISEEEALRLEGRIDMLEKELEETRDTYEKTILEKNKENKTLQSALDMQLEEQKELQEEKMKMQKTYEQKMANILSGYDGVRSALQEKHGSTAQPQLNPKKSEVSHSQTRLKRKEKQFTKWLTEDVCLPQYLTNFANTEYNRMDIVSNMDDDDLKSVGISKKMHRILLGSKIADYRSHSHGRTSSHITTSSVTDAGSPPS